MRGARDVYYLKKYLTGHGAAVADSFVSLPIKNSLTDANLFMIQTFNELVTQRFHQNIYVQLASVYNLCL